MGKSSSSPLMGGVNAAQSASVAGQHEYNIGQNTLNFEKGLWAQNQPMLDQITQGGIDAQTQNNQFSKTLENAYTQNVVPLEKQYIGQAREWGSQGQQNLNAGAAEANVAQQGDAQRSAAMSQLEGFGVDPTSTRFAALDIGTRAQQGAAQAAAGTSAMQQTKLQGMQLEGGAMTAGNGMAGAAVGASNAAAGAGMGGSNATIGGMNAASSGMVAPTAYYNSGANNINSFTNAVNGFNYAQNQSNANNNASMSGMGSLFGGLAGMFNFEDGGAVPNRGAIPDDNAPMPGGATPGGGVPVSASPTQGAIPDDVPAQLTAGEFVMPKDVVNWFGQQHFMTLIDKARKGQQQAAQRPDVGGRPTQAPATPPAFVSRPQQQQALPVGLH